MNKISFNVKFDTSVDSKNELNDFDKFWEHHFIKRITPTLVHAVKFCEKIIKNQLASHGVKAEELIGYFLKEFREHADKATEQIRNSLSYDVISTEGTFQNLNVSFEIDYSIPLSSKYCSSVEEYINVHIIDSFISQTEHSKMLTQSISSPEGARVMKMDSHFLTLLKQMKKSLLINNKPAKNFKM